MDDDAVNSTIRYLMFSVFAVERGALGWDRDPVIDETATFFKRAEDNGVVVRGLYAMAGFRADADFMIWTQAERVEALQATYTDFRRDTTIGQVCEPVWSAVAMYRAAESDKDHTPAFVAGEEPDAFICVYPFVRSLDWYLLPEEQRGQMLAEQSAAARGYEDVRTTTAMAFGLGDYEWIRALEAPKLHRIVDLMRDLHGTGAHRHLGTETPCLTGTRISLEQLVRTLP